MAKLHEVLAVESDLEGKAKRITEEASATFKSKPHLFQGKTRTLELFAGDDEVSKAAAEAAERQDQVLVTTVPDKLGYVWDTIIPHWDVVGQKEATNQIAKADIVVDGTVVMKDVPVGFLLSLESKLKQLRLVYEVIPTLEPNIQWDAAPDAGENIVRSPTTSTLKTAKITDFRTVAPATDKHQAQVVQQEKVINVGVYKQAVTSGLITPALKSDWLGRIDSLLRATKQARQRANEAPIVSVMSAQAIAQFIHGDSLAGMLANNDSAA